jgi:hypothetical protein
MRSDGPLTGRTSVDVAMVSSRAARRRSTPVGGGRDESMDFAELVYNENEPV